MVVDLMVNFFQDETNIKIAHRFDGGLIFIR